MILVTGGLGFLGAHTARALLDAGGQCLLTHHRSAEVPEFLRADVGRGVELVAVDVTKRADVFAIGDKYPVSGVIHLAATWPSNPFDEIRHNAEALAYVGEAAAAWKVKRMLVASTIGVYGGVSATRLREDVVLPHTGNGHPIPAFKKVAEIFAEQVNARAGLECVVVRVAGLYGPRYRSMRTFVSRVVHAAARETALDLTGVAFGAEPDDGADWCYVKDAARGIALLQAAPALRYRTYNVGSGTTTRNRDVVDAMRRVIPGTKLSVPESFDVPSVSAAAGLALDVNRIREDTGYVPAFPLEAGLREYVEWLRSDHPY